MRLSLRSQLYNVRARIRLLDGMLFYILVIPLNSLLGILFSIAADNPDGLHIFIVLFLLSWIPIPLRYCLRSRTRINHGQRSSLIIEREKESGKWEFQPEQIPKTITWDRENGMTYSEKDGWQPYYGSYNVILIRDKKGWARIYGDTEAFIIEIGLRKRKGFQTFHMIAAVNTDTVIPVTDENDEKVLILTNTFSERFAVRKKWMVSESQTRDFLCRLYESQDPEEAMKGFVFEDTSGLVRRLLKKKCYIVPDEYMLDFEAVTEDQEWKEKAESRLADALTEMQAEAER